jgi:hypothetical protein
MRKFNYFRVELFEPYLTDRLTISFVSLKFTTTLYLLYIDYLAHIQNVYTNNVSLTKRLLNITSHKTKRFVEETFRVETFCMCADYLYFISPLISHFWALL